ncbi:hypothetical protein M514_08460 [Trichuris suis]|uniref:Integrase catalytic domain-containing protein n=1 Tax=Trichuris suis TaxID=68888 RepID=A0A085MWG6_9BILA|nr:hypothetical protein M514_08460 [Trichuris suis]
MRSTTAGSTIRILRELFAIHGLPDSIVSDNGPQFTSEEFQVFCRDNFIPSIRVSPHHASSNGQAERMVQTTKDSLRKITHGSWGKRLTRFLLASHITPSTTTGLSLAELLMGRKLKTCLDHLHPDHAQDKQLRQDTQLIASKNERKFEPGEPVYIRTYETGPPWVPAVISKPTGPVSYEATTSDGKFVKRHADLIQRRSPEALPTENAAAPPSPAQTEKSPTPVTDPAIPSRPKRTRPPHKTAIGVFSKRRHDNKRCIDRQADRLQWKHHFHRDLFASVSRVLQ